jgi:hypothetical protein
VSFENYKSNTPYISENISYSFPIIFLSYIFLNLAMNTKTTFVIIGIAAALSLIVAPSAYASVPNDQWDEGPCEGPGQGGGNRGDDCAGGSGGSGPHDEPVTNPGGNRPPGQQEDD